jgi:protein-S-isoprenylcysteine O-methyltransferase Ste14
MSWDTFGAVAAALLGVVAGVIQLMRGREGGRAAIKRDLEILGLLPAGSKAHHELSRQVQDRVIRTIRTEEGARRDPTGVAAAVTCLLLGAVLTFLAVRNGRFWWVLLPVGVLFLGMAVYGAIVSTRRTQRDAKGNPVKEPGP